MQKSLPHDGSAPVKIQTWFPTRHEVLRWIGIPVSGVSGISALANRSENGAMLVDVALGSNHRITSSASTSATGFSATSVLG